MGCGRGDMARWDFEEGMKDMDLTFEFDGPKIYRVSYAPISHIFAVPDPYLSSQSYSGILFIIP